MPFPVVDGLRTLELGTPGAMRRRLNDLVLAGRKRATAGTTEEYDDNEYEFVGERLALVDDDLVKVGVVAVTATTLTTFGAVPWSFAQAEGEGDTSIEEWREGHARFWAGEGLAVTDDTPVFLIYFDLVNA
ncbi:MAG: ASCH domain-containing protein [Acidimicrobiales bacterium]